MPLTITVLYSAVPRQVTEKTVQVEEGATVAQALECSGLLAQFPGLAAMPVDVGVWGKKMALTRALRDKDRIEVYRPLTVDPKVARRERFAGQGAKKAAGLFAKRRAGAKAGY